MNLATTQHKILWQPVSAKQLQMISSTAYEVLCGGARGGTKTESGLAWLSLPIKQFPGYTGLVVRHSATDLRGWIRRAKIFFKPFGVRATGYPPELHFPNGAVIFTGHLRDRDAALKYIGEEFQRILIEELTLIPEESTYEQLLGSCRSTLHGLPPQLMANCNPGGPGHSWVQTRWKIEGKPPYHDRVFVADSGRTRQFIHSTLDDNPVLQERDPDYVKTIEGIKDEALRMAWRWGDWTSFVGQYFRMFSTAVHGIEPFEFDAELFPTWAAMDYGEANATSFGIYCYDKTVDRIFRVFEYYKNAEDFDIPPTASVHAEEIISALAQYPYAKLDPATLTVYADPSMWIKRRLTTEQTADSPTEVFEQYSFRMEPAINDRIPGWRKVKEVLSYKTGEEPKFGYFLGHADALEKYLPAQVHDPKNAEDVRKGPTDHVADELRYGLMMSVSSTFDLSSLYRDTGAVPLGGAVAEKF